MPKDTKAAARAASSKGGVERAKRLTPKERSEIARQGAAHRWAAAGKPPPLFAQYGADDRPLRIGDIEIPCCVLSDGRRVLIQRGMLTAMDMSQGTAGRGGGDRLAKFINSKSINPFVPSGLVDVITEPIRFRTANGADAYGYEATVLADLCDAVLDARKRGKLNYQQEHIAERCEILVRGFARVGIIALVDEATGYQDARARDALAKILERFVAKELRPWVRTFDTDYYREIFRLNAWKYEDNCGRPAVLGHWTNNIVYKRLAPGVLDELRRVTPRDESGRLKHKLFQHLTGDVGHPKLKEHLAGVKMLMKYSPNWKVFMERLDREYPQWGSTLMLPFPTDYTGPEV